MSTIDGWIAVAKEIYTNNYTSFTMDLWMSTLDQLINVDTMGPRYAEVRRVLDNLYRINAFPPIQPNQHERWLRILVDVIS